MRDYVAMLAAAMVAVGTGIVLILATTALFMLLDAARV